MIKLIEIMSIRISEKKGYAVKKYLWPCLSDWVMYQFSIRQKKGKKKDYDNF